MSPSGLRSATGWAVLPIQRTSFFATRGALAVRPTPIRQHSTVPPSSVSASEVSHFTALASSWWDPHGPSRLLHLMNPLRHDFIRSCVDSTSADGPRGSERGGKYTYLDIGCGGGIFASSAARLPSTASVTAIDPTPDVIKVAKAQQRSDPLLSQPDKLQYLNCAIEDLDSKLGHEARGDKAQYDIVTLFEVIEHISKPSAFLRIALSHLKPGGWLVGSTIARHPLSYFTTKVVAEAPWPIGVVPSGTHDWDKYINPGELVEWFNKENIPRHDSKTGGATPSRASDQEVQNSDRYGDVKIAGCAYLPLLGWKFIDGSQEYGNYFFGVQKLS